MSSIPNFRDAETVTVQASKKSFFASHKLLSVAFLFLAIGLAFGAYIYLQPNIVVDSIPPFVHHSQPIEWKTYTDSQAGFEFKYPVELAANYIRVETWPPQVKVAT